MAVRTAFHHAVATTTRALAMKRSRPFRKQTLRLMHLDKLQSMTAKKKKVQEQKKTRMVQGHGVATQVIAGIGIGQ